jgi:hypothetical protein
MTGWKRAREEKIAKTPKDAKLLNLPFRVAQTPNQNFLGALGAAGALEILSLSNQLTR